MPLDHEAILRLLFAARSRLSAAAYVVVRDLQVAEDIFQNVALKSVTKDVSFEHEGALLSWAMVTAKREGIDWLRKRKPETVGLEEEVLDLLHREWNTAGAGPAAPGEGDRMTALRDCLDRIPRHSRQLLEMRYFEGRSCGEVAESIGIGLDAVYQRLSRLHRQLRKCIDQRLGAQSL